MVSKIYRRLSHPENPTIPFHVSRRLLKWIAGDRTSLFVFKATSFDQFISWSLTGNSIKLAYRLFQRQMFRFRLNDRCVLPTDWNLTLVNSVRTFQISASGVGIRIKRNRTKTLKFRILITTDFLVFASRLFSISCGVLFFIREP